MMQLAYLPANRSGFAAHLIDGLSGFGGICHVELVFSDGDTLRASYGEVVTIARRDHAGWTLEEVPDVPWAAERLVRGWAEGELGCPYDTWGVARFVAPCLDQHPDAWFCSEICVAALQRIGRLPGVIPWRVSPNGLRKLDKRPRP